MARGHASISGFPYQSRRSVERRTIFEAQAQRACLPFVRFPAIDGQTINRRDPSLYDSATTMAATGYDLSATEIGCCMSHVKVWQTALTRSYEWALVLEGDAVINTRLLEVLAHIERLPTNWEIVILQREGAHRPFIRHTFLPDLDVLRHTRVGFLSTGYLIHRRALDRLGRCLFPIRWPIDHWHKWWAICGLVIYRTDADLVTPNSAPESTMQNRVRDPARVPLTISQTLARLLWRMKERLLRSYRLTLALTANLRGWAQRR